jgi:hypothetical protein
VGETIGQEDDGGHDQPRVTGGVSPVRWR